MHNDGDQVLIQPMLLNVQLSGVAFTRTLEHSAPWYVINYETSGDTEAIASGNSSNHNTWIVRKKISNFELFSVPDKRLQLLVIALKEIEELLGYDALDVEFAIDSNQIIHILQVRPITVKSYQAKISDNTYDDFIESAQASFKTLSCPPPFLPGNSQPLMGVMPDWNPAEIIGTSPGSLAISLCQLWMIYGRNSG